MMAITIEAIFMESEKLGNRKETIKGYEIPANIEPKDTYLNMISIRRNTPKVRSAGPVVRVITTPNKAATPLPPLKPANNGKIWPIKAINPNKI